MNNETKSAAVSKAQLNKLTRLQAKIDSAWKSARELESEGVITTAILAYLEDTSATLSVETVLAYRSAYRSLN